MYGLMTEESINETLEAMDKAAKEALKSKESAIKFLQEVGILDENGEPTEMWKEAMEND